MMDLKNYDPRIDSKQGQYATMAANVPSTPRGAEHAIAELENRVETLNYQINALFERFAPVIRNELLNEPNDLCPFEVAENASPLTSQIGQIDTRLCDAIRTLRRLQNGFDW